MQAEAPVPAETVRRWLRVEGADPAAPAEEQLGLAWRLLRRAEARLGELERRRAEEMRDVRAGVTPSFFFSPNTPFSPSFCSSTFTGVDSRKLLFPLALGGGCAAQFLALGHRKASCLP